MTFHSTVTAYLVAQGFEVEDFPESDRVILRVPHKGRHVDLRIKGKNWGDVEGVFFRNCYDFISAPNDVVLDVGASVGDSALFFAVEGAKKVVAVEPYPAAYDLLVINATNGGFPGVIEPVNAALGRTAGIMVLNPRLEGIGILASPSPRGTGIPVVTLSQLVKRYGIVNGTLKMDCEGAEDEALQACDDFTLRSFARMQIEFHHGYEHIEERLKRAHFRVSHSQPQTNMRKALGVVISSGFIYAERL